jgi:inosose dehydratase
MLLRLSRRDFLTSAAAAAATTLATSVPTVVAGMRPRLYAAMDLSYFDTPISPAPSEIHIGYASITWSGKDREAIEDIASLGFRGIQLRANVIKEFGTTAELRELLDQHKLSMVALSSGGVSIDPTKEAEEIAKHTANAKFVREVEGLYLQVTDERPKDRAITSADYKRLGKMLTEIGKRTADLGISLGYHNHMGSLGERPEEVHQILEAADPRYAKLELDVAHYFQGGGDPAKAIEKYSDRLLFLHIKDVERLPQNADTKSRYRFVELGRGKVDLPAVFDALHKVNFRGWAIVELDAVPDKTRTPKDSGAISKKYLEEKLGVTV